MPYKAVGKAVLVQRGGTWVVVFRHDSEAEAQRHAAALNIHVTKKEKGKK